MADQLIGMFEDFRRDTPPDFEAMLNRRGQSPSDLPYLMEKGREYLRGLSAILGYWTAARVEEAALRYAIEWTTQPGIAAQYDVAMTYYLGWSNNRMHHFQHEDHFTAAYLGRLHDAIGDLLREVRARVEFIATRAADIRISGKLEDVARALIERESDSLGRALRDLLLRNSGEHIDVKALIRSIAEIANSHPELRAAPEAIVHKIVNQAADEALRDKPETRNTLERIKGAALTIGLNIASNGLYDGLFWLLRHH